MFFLSIIKMIGKGEEMLLGVNIDHIATLRNARGENYPSPIEGAEICLKAGANCITAHLREDRRHIKDDDIKNLKALGCKLNMEMAATDEMQKIALDILPYSVCIVPEKRQEITTEGGLDIISQQTRMKSFVEPLIEAGIIVSMFINPDLNQIEAAKNINAQFIELHTGAYSRAFGTDNEEFEFQKLKNSAEFAKKINIRINAGHGLDYQNVHRMHEINGIEELNIGHSIISRAIFTGLNNAVIEMIKACN